ncbi:MAG TPA: phosphoglycerate kinase [Longimicrobiaceae bacterium]|nr:phosphoglycerate kinase [Longimicrobiaceae bacterium]
MEKLTLADIPDDDLTGKRVLVRVDFNVPLDSQERVADDTRIRASLPTLRRLATAGARTIIISHLGRPRGKRVPEMSLRPAARRLAELVDVPVHFVGETVGKQAIIATRALAAGEFLVLENTRFLPGDEQNDEGLAEDLAGLGDLFVNDAFGAAHRAHASTSGVAAAMKARGDLAVAGELMRRELEYLGRTLGNPQHPFVAILGGAKISGKIDVIESLLPRADRILVGGAMANTFFAARDLPTGTSLVEEDRIPMARELLARAGDTVILPLDVVVAPALDEPESSRTVDIDSIPTDMMALDIGPKTVDAFTAEIVAAMTVLWNGPMGVFEVREFSDGTRGVARALVEATRAGATTIVGGGDSAAALTDLDLHDDVSHVSTGGGASLEFIEGKGLPGVESLSDRGDI